MGDFLSQIKSKSIVSQRLKKLSLLSYVDLATEIIFNFCSPSLEKIN